MKQIFEVKNIKCEGCVNAIRNGLENLPGVQSVLPEIQSKSVIVDFDNQQTTVDQISDRLASLGYPATDSKTAEN